MPKRRAPTYDTKPKSPAHPSLSSSRPKDSSHSLTSSGTPNGNSVNDKIQQLRLSERHASPSADFRPSSELLNPNSSPSLPPSLRNILQIPDAPSPRPRPGLRVTRGRRGPAGPAAPQSWLRQTPTANRESRRGLPTARDGQTTNVESLPGAYLPDDGSLLATALKAIARDWDWHRVYDQYYLATIPVRYKEALLHYIVQHYDHGIDKDGLELLFQDETSLEDATGADGLTHLDLARSVGDSLKLSELKALLSNRQPPSGLTDSTSSDTLESWDDISTLSSALTPTSTFSNLTHLSLSHPPPSISWKSLLDLSPSLTTLTHLSLAHWPPPTLTPNSRTAYRDTPLGAVNYGASNYYSEHDNDWSEAASILRRLSKNTYCLQWLDLTGCRAWVMALEKLEAEWYGAWRGLETVRVGQGWVPEYLSTRETMRAGADGGLEGGWEVAAWLDFERDTTRLEWAVNAKIRGRGRVTFERGWDAWWIREAVDDFTII